MATNLRLRSDAEEAVRLAAERTQRSQQDVIRDAIDRYLGLASDTAPRTDLDRLIDTGTVRPARSSYRVAANRIRLPAGVTSADLLNREDRM